MKTQDVNKDKLVKDLYKVHSVLGTNFSLDIDHGYWTGKFYHSCGSIPIYAATAAEENAINFLRNEGVRISSYLKSGTLLHDEFFSAVDDTTHHELELMTDEEACAIVVIRNLLPQVIWHLETC